MVDSDKVLQIIRMKGPILPVELVREVGGNTMIAGAMLSDLVKNRKVRISNAKIGSSPVYYVQGQESKLSMLYKGLHEKEKRAYDLLYENKVLRDKELAPVERVALREIKDFAVPLEVNLKTGKEIFWKWHQTPTSQIEIMIKEMLGLNKKTEPEKQEQKSDIQNQANEEELKRKEEEYKREQERESLEEEKKRIEEERARLEREKEELKEKAEKEKETKEKKESEDNREKTEPEKKNQETRQEKKSEQMGSGSDKQDTLVKEPITEKKQAEIPKDDFVKTINNNFKQKNITIKKIDVIRKNSDIEMTVTVPTAIGNVDFFCKARNKKKSNDGDLSSTYLQGQTKKMPAIYLTTGEITNKALDKLKTDFKGLIVIRI